MDIAHHANLTTFGVIGVILAGKVVLVAHVIQTVRVHLANLVIGTTCVMLNAAMVAKTLCLAKVLMENAHHANLDIGEEDVRNVKMAAKTANVMLTMDHVHVGLITLGYGVNIGALGIFETAIVITLLIRIAHYACPVIGVKLVITSATTDVLMVHATCKADVVLHVKRDIGVSPVSIDAVIFVLGYVMYQMAGVHLVKLDFGEITVNIHAMKDVVMKSAIKLMVRVLVKMASLVIHAMAFVYQTVKHAV